MFQADDWENIGRHLAFRDYMRSREKERNEYANLKKDLAQRFPYDIDGYCDGKEDFVREMEKRALAQYDGTWDKLYIAARKVQYERKISPPDRGRRRCRGASFRKRDDLYRRLH